MQLDASPWSGATVVYLPADADIAKLGETRQDYARSRPFDSDTGRDFELRKDMARLESARTLEEKKEVLLRLADYPWIVGDERGIEAPAGFFEGIVRRYVDDKKTVREIEQRHSDALFDLGLMKQQDLVPYARHRAEQGNARFEYQYGRILAADDPVHAVYWLRKSADAGFATGTLELARIYAETDWKKHAPSMVGKSQALAAATLQRAATQARVLAMRDDPWGLMLFAEMAEGSLGGLQMSRDQARSLYCKALKTVPRGHPAFWNPLPPDCGQG
jgi:hypothetical protein